jgi:hypothetical protein
VRQQRGDLAGAQAILERALGIFDRAGEDAQGVLSGVGSAPLQARSQTLAGTLFNLGVVLRERGDLRGAVPKLQRACDKLFAITGRSIAWADMVLVLATLHAELHDGPSLARVAMGAFTAY